MHQKTTLPIPDPSPSPISFLAPEVVILQRHHGLLELVLGGLAHGAHQEVHLLVEVLQLAPDDRQRDASRAEAHPVSDGRQYEVEASLG